MEDLILSIRRLPGVLRQWCANNIPAPGCGAGCHHKLLSAANYGVAAGLDPDTIGKLILSGVPKGTRDITSEVIGPQGAVAKASTDVPVVITPEGELDVEAWAQFKMLLKLGGAGRGIRGVNPLMIPDIRMSLAGPEIVIDALSKLGNLPGNALPTPEPDSTWFDQPRDSPLPTSLGEFLLRMYGSGSYVLIGNTKPFKTKNGYLDGVPFKSETKLVEQWVAQLDAKGDLLQPYIPQIMLNPHRGTAGKTNNGVGNASYRAKECFYPQYIVLEGDNMSIKLQCEMARGLIEAGLPVVSIVWSGKKSLHVALRVSPSPSQADQEYRSFARGVAKPLGYDPATVRWSSYSRTPFVMRGDKPQRLLYFNEHARYQSVTFSDLLNKLAKIGGKDCEALTSTRLPYFRRLKMVDGRNGGKPQPSELAPGEMNEELEVQGYYTAQDDSLVQVKNMVINTVTKDQVVRAPSQAMLDYIEAGVEHVNLPYDGEEDQELMRVPSRKLRNWFVSKRVQGAIGVQPGQLASIPGEKHGDLHNCCYVYDEHKAVEIQAEKVAATPIDELGNCVARGEILPRAIELDWNNGYQTGVWATFLKKIAGPMGLPALEAALAYLMHRFKDPALAWSVLFTDSTSGVSGLPSGGSGKSLTCQGLSMFRQTTILPGKKYDNNNRFCLQNVNRLDSLIIIDDVNRTHNFEGDYNIITDNMEIERKNKSAEIIPFNLSPKLAYTSNTIPGDTSISSSRRITPIRLSDFFGLHRRPDEYFGQRLFDDWVKPKGDELEYQRFVMYMIDLMQRYLRGALPRPKSDIGCERAQFMEKTNDNDDLLKFFKKHKIFSGITWKVSDIVNGMNNMSGLTGPSYGEYEYKAVLTMVGHFRDSFKNAHIKLRKTSTDAYLTVGDPSGIALDDDTENTIDESILD